MATSFSRVLSSTTDARTFEVPDDWLQGRSLFGGLQVALALRAMRAHVPSMPLRVVQATFIAPVPAGRVQVDVQVLRRGKNTVHVEARLGTGETQALVVAVYGTARPSAVAREPVRGPVQTSDAPLVLPFIEGLTPTFTQHFHVRWLRGTPPFTGGTTPLHTVEVTLRDEVAYASDEHLAAIADFIPPLGLSYLSAPAAGSTVTWMLELLRDRYDDLPLEGWLVDGELAAARGGYTSQAVTLWAPDGTIAALGHQSMLVFG